MIVHAATLDVSVELAQYVAWLLFAERCRRGTPSGARALTCFWQAVLGLRWFRDRLAPERLGRDHGVSRATSYRYLDEVIAVLAVQAPDIHQALHHAQDQGMEYVLLDGSVLSSDRCSETTTSTQGYTIDAWYSGKAAQHGETSKLCPLRAGSHCGP